MIETGIHTTADGWTIPTNMTIAAIAGTQLRLANGDESTAAERYGYSTGELRERLADHRLPPAPKVTTEAAALLAQALPGVGLLSPGGGTENDLIRLCDMASALDTGRSVLDSIQGATLYKPPAAFATRVDALNQLFMQARDAAASIRATTLAGLRAKGRVIEACGPNLECDSLDDQPMVLSLLADCGALLH